jgi:hypothetical protein
MGVSGVCEIRHKASRMTALALQDDLGGEDDVFPSPLAGEGGSPRGGETG